LSSASASPNILSRGRWTNFFLLHLAATTSSPRRRIPTGVHTVDHHSPRSIATRHPFPLPSTESPVLAVAGIGPESRRIEQCPVVDLRPIPVVTRSILSRKVHRSMGRYRLTAANQNRPTTTAVDLGQTPLRTAATSIFVNVRPSHWPDGGFITTAIW
jgi:hypothetical protein